MNTTQAVLRRESYTEKAVLYMALELSHKTWRLVFSAGGKERQVSIEARNLMRLGEERPCVGAILHRGNWLFIHHSYTPNPRFRELPW